MARWTTSGLMKGPRTGHAGLRDGPASSPDEPCLPEQRPTHSRPPAHRVGLGSSWVSRVVRIVRDCSREGTSAVSLNPPVSLLELRSPRKPLSTVLHVITDRLAGQALRAGDEKERTMGGRTRGEKRRFRQSRVKARVG